MSNKKFKTVMMIVVPLFMTLWMIGFMWVMISVCKDGDQARKARNNLQWKPGWKDNNFITFDRGQTWYYLIPTTTNKTEK